MKIRHLHLLFTLREFSMIWDTALLPCWMRIGRSCVVVLSSWLGVIILSVPSSLPLFAPSSLLGRVEGFLAALLTTCSSQNLDDATGGALERALTGSFRKSCSVRPKDFFCSLRFCNSKSFSFAPTSSWNNLIAIEKACNASSSVFFVWRTVTAGRSRKEPDAYLSGLPSIIDK